MTETDRIKSALVNVITLAKNSDYYSKKRYGRDIALIASIVEKEIPKKPYFKFGGFADGYPVYDTWICPNCCENYETEVDKYDYCPKCGQRIDWEEQQ